MSNISSSYDKNYFAKFVSVLMQRGYIIQMESFKYERLILNDHNISSIELELYTLTGHLRLQVLENKIPFRPVGVYEYTDSEQYWYRVLDTIALQSIENEMEFLDNIGFIVDGTK